MRPLVKKITSSLIAFMLVGGISAALQADEIPDRGPVPFSLYDTDGDNLISEDEFYDLRAKRMQKRADDGYPMRNAGNAPDFSEFDTDGDGMLSPQELTAGQQAQMSSKGGRGMGQGPGAR